MLAILLSIITLLTDWQFAPEQLPHQMPAVSSAEWQSVQVPHDWAISGPFDIQNDLQVVAVVQNGEQVASAKTGRTGGLPWTGAAWYRCQVCLNDNKDYENYESNENNESNENYAKPFYRLYIDGAMSRAEVYVNDQKLAFSPYGYSAFEVPISDLLLPEEIRDTLTIAIRLENKPESSRWYPGAGLFRRVELHQSARTHIPSWGVHITTPLIQEQSGEVVVHTEIANPTADMEVQNDVLYNGKVIATFTGTEASTRIKNPKYWSPEQPNLYILRTRVWDNGQVMDEVNTRFGFRTLSYEPGKGFLFNGQVRKFRGVCLHHDLGPLGAAVHRDAIRHQITLLKDMGCDAIRTSHNMPSSDLVELCEEMGIMLMVEPFDVWKYAKIQNDYSTYFNKWAEHDLSQMIRHFRSSPAVVMWSVGNEVWDQVQPDGDKTAAWLQEICHRLDSTRPVTCGMDQVKDVIHNGFADVFDIVGLNYRTGRYLEAHQSIPSKLIVGSETASTVSSRGVYKFPVVIQPDAHYPDNQSSGYDMEYCAWSGLPDQDFALMDDYPWTIGQFVWTGFDYLGEPSPYDTDAWPSHSSYFGIIDLASLPKDRYWLYRSQWNTQSPTLHMLPHWTWPGREGQITPVFVYTSYPQAEVFVNGVSQGRLRFATADESQRLAQGETIPGVSTMPSVGQFDIPIWGSAPQPELIPRYRLMWQDVVYQPGEIKVIAYDAKGKAVAQQVCRTAGEPHHLEAIWANKGEKTEEKLQYITLRVVDQNGQLCPHATHEVHIQTDGEFMGAANGDATCLMPLTKPQMKVFGGECTFIVRSAKKVELHSDGLEPAILLFH